MQDEKLLDLDALRAKERDGLQLGGRQIPWVAVGPIEAARFTALQGEIADISDDAAPDPISVEDATRIVRIQRESLRLILPSITQEEEADLSDEEVGLVIRFFNVRRTDMAVRDAEDQLQRAETANAVGAKARQIGGRSSRRSRGTTGASPAPG